MLEASAAQVISAVTDTIVDISEDEVNMCQAIKELMEDSRNAIKISFAAMCSRKLFMIFRKIAKNK